jgi:hypothetical protein
VDIAEFCREIETYLCRKNDGHLIRVVGPSFDLVSRWAADGIPLKVAFRGIDQYFERYYRKGPRRRPVKIDFCEADVLDAFDGWRNAVGLPKGAGAAADEVDGPAQPRNRQSLPAHLERVAMRLTSARAGGSVGAAFDEVIDRVGRELDIARADARGLRGEARSALLERLTALDRELLSTARDAAGPERRAALAIEADSELARFRDTMTAEAYARAREAAVDRLLREQMGLPIISF